MEVLRIGRGIFSILQKEDVPLLLCVVLVCVAPLVGQFCILMAFGINMYRLLKYDINIFIFDLLCLMPFANIYKIAPRTPSLVLALILVGCVLFLIRANNMCKSVGPVVVIACVFLFMRSGLVFNSLVSIIGSLVLVCLFAKNYEDNQVIRIAYGYTIAVALSVIVGYLSLSANLYVDYISEEIQVSKFSDATRFKGLFSDPNYLGSYLLSAIGILGQLFVAKRIKISLFVALLAILTFGGIVSYSKSFFLAFIAIIILLIISLWNQGNKKWAFLLLVAFVIAGAYAVQGLFSDVNIILDRFSQDADVNDLTTGRSMLWAKYADNIISDIGVFFGNGLDAPLLVQGAHNLYLETMYHVGVIGMFLIVAAFASSFRRTIRDYRCYSIGEKSVAILSFVIILVVYWSLQGLFGFATYFQIFITILMLRIPVLKE